MDGPAPISDLNDLLVEYLLLEVRSGGLLMKVKDGLMRLRIGGDPLPFVRRVEDLLLREGAFFHAGDDRVYFQASALALFARSRMGHKSGFITDWVDAQLEGLATRRRRLPFLNKDGEYDVRLSVGVPWSVLSGYLATAARYERDPLSRYPAPENLLLEILHTAPSFSSFPDTLSGLRHWRDLSAGNRFHRREFEAKALETFGARYNPARDSVMFCPEHLLASMQEKGVWTGWSRDAVADLLSRIDGAEMGHWDIHALRLRDGKPLPKAFVESRTLRMASIPWTVIKAAAGDSGGEIERECYGGWDARPEMGGEEIGAPDFVPLPAGAGIDYYDDGL